MRLFTVALLGYYTAQSVKLMKAEADAENALDFAECECDT